MAFLSPIGVPRTARANVYIFPLVTADGISKTYELGKVIPGKTALQIYIDGNYQDQAAFNVGFNATSVLFTDAPPKDTKIEFRLITNEDKLRTVDDQVIQSKHIEPDFLKKITRTGFKNKLINGNFDIWQRGTTQTTGGYGSADRWYNTHVGSTKLASQQSFSTGQVEVPGNPKYFYRTVVNSVAGAANYCHIWQAIEGLSLLAGKTVTVSFYAKADSAKNIALDFTQYFGVGGSATVNSIGSTKISLTTSWKKYSVTVDIPNLIGKTIGSDTAAIRLFFWYEAGTDYAARTNSLGNQSGIFDLARIQVEEGPVATDFEERFIGDEWRLCQRYYQTINTFNTSYGTAGMEIKVDYNYGKMRSAPTVTPFVSYSNCSGYNITFADTTRLVAGYIITATGSATANTYANLDAEL